MRKERRYEVAQGDMLIEAILSDGGNIVPNSMGRPTFQQICRGEFDDFLANCIFRMYDLTEREYLRQIVLNLKQDHKEILYFWAYADIPYSSWQICASNPNATSARFAALCIESCKNRYMKHLES